MSDKPQFLADTPEALFGPKPQFLAQSPEALFGPKPEPGLMSRIGGFLSNHLLPDPGTLLGGEPLKLPKPGEPHPSVISPIVDAAVRGFGADRLGLSDETEQFFRDAGIFNDWQKEDQSLWRTLNEAAIRSAAVPIDAMLRGLGAGFVGGQEVVNQALGDTALSRDIAALPEAFQGSPHSLGPMRGPGEAIRVVPSGPEAALGEAMRLDVIGKGEAGWAGAPSEAAQQLQPTGRPTPTERVRVPAERPAETAPALAETPGAVPDAAPQAPPAPDLHAVARQIAPPLFEEYDALAARRETFRGWLDELAAQRERRMSPEIADIDSQIDALREQRLSAARRDRAELANRIAGLESRRASLLDALPEAGDTPEMQTVRRALQETDYRMRDLAPEVSAAYRRAAEEGAPVEAKPAEGEPVTAPAAAAAPAEVAPVAQERPAAAPIEGGIAGDVAKQLVAAGRPAEEAGAAAALVQAHYEARAARFGGKKGTAEDLYRTDAPQIRGKETGGRGGMAAGKTRIINDRAVITLFRRADASTFIHETGHHWLDEMMRDAVDPLAPVDLAADAKAVRDWLGVEGGVAIPTRAHEKFARGFERYMMEGHAPTAGLARVFDQFKRWLTRIYETVTRLRAPINDDIRAVFDRMLSTPEQRAVVAAERETTKAFADIHEGDIAATPPEHAVTVADTLQAERDRIAAEAPPEVQSGRPNRRAGSEDRGPQRGDRALDRGGDEGQPQPAGAGDGAELGAVGAGGNAVAPQGAGVAAGAERTAGAATTVPGEPNTRFERAPEAGVIDKAGNIRLDLLNTPEDVNTILRQAAAESGEFLTERRGVISDAEAMRLADALGMDPARLNRRKIGAAFNAEEVIAARKMLIQSATQVRDAMRKAATGADADVLAYAEAKARHLMIQGQVSGVTAEAGRALRAFRALEGSAEAEQLGEFLKRATGRDLFQMREEAQLGLSLDTPQKVSKFIRDSAKPKFIDMVHEFWINALLSGPKTHATNIISNALIALYSVPETAMAAGIGRVRQLLPGADAARVEMGEAGARAFGILRGSAEGVRAGWELLKNEDLTDLNMKVEQRRFQAIPGKTGQAVRIFGRLLGAEDKVFKGIAYRQELNALSYRQAMQEGLSGDRFAQRIAELTNDPTEAMMEAARKTADYQTFNNNLGQTGQALMRFANSHPIIKFIIPFIRTPINIVKYAAERSPFGLLMKDVRDNIAGKNGAIARDTQIARVALGTAVGVTGAYLAAQGLLTGGGPGDPRKRAALYLTGWQPYSVKIGEMYYSFGRAEPLGSLLGVAGDMYEVAHAASEDEHASVAKMVLSSLAKNLTSKTWLKGPSDLIQAVTDPDRYGQNYIKGLAGTIVPAFVAQTAQATDPYMREAHGVIAGIKARTPGMSETLLPRRDVWGEPVERNDAVGPMGITGIAESRINNDPANQALLRVGAFPAKLQRKVRGVELTDEQYDEMARLAGRSAKMRVDALVRMPGFQTLPDGAQREALGKAISESREMARGVIMMKNPEIIAKAVEAKKAQLQGAKH